MNWVKLSVAGWVGLLGVGCSAHNDLAVRAEPNVAGGPEPTLTEIVAQDVNCGKDGFIRNPQGLAFAAVAFGVSDACGGLISDCLNPPPGSTTAVIACSSPAGSPAVAVPAATGAVPTDPRSTRPPRSGYTPMFDLPDIESFIAGGPSGARSRGDRSQSGATWATQSSKRVVSSLWS